MSSLLGELGQSAANLPAEAVAFALGIAAGRALEAPGTELAQKTWQALPIKAVDPLTAAAIVAENVQDETWGEGEAAAYGFNSDRFKAIVGEVLAAPGFGELLRMLRRDSITTDDLTHGFRKLKLETRWDTALADLQTERVDPSVVATAIQRGIMPDPGYLPTTIDFSGADVPAPAVSALDPVAEAKASGITSDRLAVYARIVGLPPAPGELLQLVNRGEINDASFRMGIAEGNTRNEWADKLLTLKRRLLTPHEYAELQLRGWITQGARDTGASLSGMEPGDTQLLFDMLGRPLNVHAVTTGLARGGTYGGDYAGVPEPYQTALRQSNVRPEWGNLAYSNRYTYPSAFVIRTLATTGELAPADVTKTLLDIGWKPDLVDKVVTAWTGGTTTKGDPHVTKAETQLWGTLHKAYVDSRADDATADTQLAALGVADAARPEVLDLWKRERLIVRAGLTAAEIRKTVGLPGWTDAERMARLAELGYSTEDATTFLAE